MRKVFWLLETLRYDERDNEKGEKKKKDYYERKREKVVNRFKRNRCFKKVKANNKEL